MTAVLLNGGARFRSKCELSRVAFHDGMSYCGTAWRLRREKIRAKRIAVCSILEGNNPPGNNQSGLAMFGQYQ